MDLLSSPLKNSLDTSRLVSVEFIPFCGLYILDYFNEGASRVVSTRNGARKSSGVNASERGQRWMVFVVTKLESGDKTIADTGYSWMTYPSRSGHIRTIGSSSYNLDSVRQPSGLRLEA